MADDKDLPSADAQEHNLNEPSSQSQESFLEENGYAPTIFIGEGNEARVRVPQSNSTRDHGALGSFGLRGHPINPIIDASMPLMGLYVRLQSSQRFEAIEALHKRLSEEIQRIEIEITQAGYDRAVVLAHRYCLCTFVDEGVMTTPWGANSFWDANTMLSEFHNERWGGEKFFVVLDRLRREPERYTHMLEFLYVCMSLGYMGRYRVEDNGRIKFERILDDLYTQIERIRGETGEFLTRAQRNVTPQDVRLNRLFPYWGIWLLTLLAAGGIFAGFWLNLNEPVTEIVENLRAEEAELQDLEGVDDPQDPASTAPIPASLERP